MSDSVIPSEVINRQRSYNLYKRSYTIRDHRPSEVIQSSEVIQTSDVIKPSKVIQPSEIIHIRGHRQSQVRDH